MAVGTQTVYGADLLLIVARRDGRVLAVDGNLAVFSGEVEANLFLRSAVEEDEWEVKRASPEKIISMLDSADAGRVALDPSPEIMAQSLLGLVSIGRRLFLRRFSRYDQSLRVPAAPRVVRRLRVAT